MNEYGQVLGLALLPAFGNILGGLLSEVLEVSEKTLSLTLHAAAGVVLAVVGLELVPRGLQASPAWVIVLAFIAGGVGYICIDSVLERVQRQEHCRGQAGPWAIFFGVMVDLLSDGVMIGTGSTVAVQLGLLLALAQMPADIPEGFATMATLRTQGMPRRWRLVLATSFVMPIVLGATIGYWVLRERAAIWKMATLAFTAGILLSVVVEDMVQEAHRGAESRWAALALVCGFGLFAPITVYTGGL
jgi:ZIP family zinc transporter